jgi:hypothetical protein
MRAFRGAHPGERPSTILAPGAMFRATPAPTPALVSDDTLPSEPTEPRRDDAALPSGASSAADVPSRRRFLKVAGVAAAGAAASAAGVTASCAPGSDGERPAAAARGARGARRGAVELDRGTLDALGDVMLPGAIGAAGRKAAVDAFVQWVDGYDPVAEEMHGYGYADIRYLPSDPAPNWRAQLEGLDLLARKSRRAAFADCDATTRLELVTAALRGVRTPRLPDPLGAPHVAVALLSHWTASPAARDLAFGVQLGAGTCRSLEGVSARPLPLAPTSA